ncbi:DUF4876 domain-containing protein [Labilibaculum euxinus]
MKKLIFGLSLLMVVSLFSCSDDDDPILQSDLNLVLNPPAKLKAPTFKNGTVTVTNVNSGEEISKDLYGFMLPTLNLEDGLYNFTVEAEVDYFTRDVDDKIIYATTGIRGFSENVEVTGGSFDLTIDLFEYRKNTSFVISEIFFSGTKTPEGKQYNDDKYFEIYNNTDKILYADGLCIAESELNTAQSLNEYTPDVRKEYTPVSSVYRIPGDGDDYPVEPGKSIIVCDVAIDHSAENANSFDLSIADFEWFDGADVDVDVPEVPNMEKMVSTSASVWGLHNRGFTSYVIFKMDDMTPEKFNTDNAYHYQYTFVWGDFVKVMDFDAWKVPNNIIIDAVECSTVSDYEWKALDPSLDLTWTHAGDGDDARYGKCVKRKVSHKEGNRIVLLDTNNSEFDFIPTADPTPGIIEEE